MAIKRGAEQILIIVGASCIVGLITWAIVTLILVDKSQGKTTDKIKNIEKRMDKYEVKQDKLITSSNMTNSTLKLLVYQVKQNNDIMKEIKANQRGSFASYIERKKAQYRPLKDNIKIASSSP